MYRSFIMYFFFFFTRWMNCCHTFETLLNLIQNIMKSFNSRSRLFVISDTFFFYERKNKKPVKCL